MILILQLYRATTYNKKKKKFVVFMQPLKLNSFFSFNFTIFFGLVLKADWIFLFKAQMIQILLWTLKCYDIKITKKKKKENTKWKKKSKQEFWLDKLLNISHKEMNHACTIQILWLKNEMYMFPPWD